jgi:hypothetical protein
MIFIINHVKIRLCLRDTFFLDQLHDCIYLRNQFFRVEDFNNFVSLHFNKP